MFNLSGKVALVTGSARGLGLAIAFGLARAGAAVIMNDLHTEKLAQETLEQMGKLNPDCIAIPADVSDEHQVRLMFGQVADRFGRLDILVNNAGSSAAEDIFETSLDSWKAILDNNLTSTFLCSKYAMQIMSKQRAGRIIQISSVVGHQGALFGHVHYASSKSGQMGFTKTLARTAAPYGVTVNCLAPGVIETELLYQTLGDERVSELAEQIPLGLGRAEDVAAAALFLASDEARYITGITLDINGGQYMN